MKLYVVTVENAEETQMFFRFFVAESWEDFYLKAKIGDWIGREEIALTQSEILGSKSCKMITRAEALDVIRKKIFRGEEFGVEIDTHSWGAKVEEFNFDPITQIFLSKFGLLPSIDEIDFSE